MDAKYSFCYACRADGEFRLAIKQLNIQAKEASTRACVSKAESSNVLLEKLQPVKNSSP
jgi:hypothetical protein